MAEEKNKRFLSNCYYLDCSAQEEEKERSARYCLFNSNDSNRGEEKEKNSDKSEHICSECSDVHQNVTQQEMKSFEDILSPENSSFLGRSGNYTPTRSTNNYTTVDTKLEVKIDKKDKKEELTTDVLQLNEKNLEIKLKASELLKTGMDEDNLRNFFIEWAELDVNFAEKLLKKYEQYTSLKKKTSKFITTGGERNWNQEFQILVENDISDMGNTELYKKMNLLVGDFSHAASLYAQIIISELCLTFEQKTIKPVDVGGVAGGAKYIVGGILFKFAVDQLVSESPRVYMYGGDKPRDDLAMKAAARELQSLGLLFATSPKILHFPLVAIVDYLGYRVIASSLLPIDKNTIKYGSNDGGATVKFEIEELNNAMAAAGDIQNLAPHEVGREGHPICGPGDIEAHLGHDGRYYVIDCARLMPPEAPPLDKAERMKDPRGVFYKLLRHELLSESTEKFSSDCFTGWSRYDKKRTENEQKVRSLTEYLYKKTIPEFALSFEEQNFSNVNQNQNQNSNLCLGLHRTDLNSFNSVELFRVIDRLDVIFMMHFVGINLRHLGRVRSNIKSPIHRQLLLSHCAARAIKNVLREKLRNEMKNLYGSPSDIPFREIIIREFNLIVGKSLASEEYWKVIQEKMLEDFPECLSTEERDITYDVRKSLEMRSVVYLFYKITSVNISPRAFTSMSENINSFRMVSSDIISTSPTVKELYISSMSSALLLKRNANTLDDTEAKYRLLLSAKSDVQRALRIVPKCPKIAKLYAQILMDLFAIDTNEENCEVYLNTIITQLIYALNFIPSATYSVALDALKLVDTFSKKNKLHGVKKLVNKLQEVKETFGLTLDDYKGTCASQYLDYRKMKTNYINLLHFPSIPQSTENTPTSTPSLSTPTSTPDTDQLISDSSYYVSDGNVGENIITGNNNKDIDIPTKIIEIDTKNSETTVGGYVDDQQVSYIV